VFIEANDDGGGGDNWTTGATGKPKFLGFGGSMVAAFVEVWLILTQVSTAECQGHQREEVQVAQVMAN